MIYKKTIYSQTFYLDPNNLPNQLRNEGNIPVYAGDDN